MSKIHSFKNHPFKVINDESMKNMIESIKRYGVITPIILRPREEGGYELISGHRMVYASNLAEKEKIPAILRELDNDASVILMVDSM